MNNVGLNDFLDYLFKLNHGLVDSKKATEEGFVLSLGDKSVKIPLDGISYNLFVRALEELQ